MVWIEIDDDEPRGLALAECRHDVFDRGLGGELDLGAGKAEPLGAQPHLRHRLLAGNVDRPLAGAGQRGRDLDQQRRLADAGVTAHEQDRAAHEAAAGDAIELGESGGEPRCVARRACEWLEREQAALARCAAGHLRTRGGRVLLGDGVPFTAGIALALPAAIGRAAVLADEAQFASGHD